MIINTKYTTGDKVWIISNNKVIETTIVSLEIKVYKKDVGSPSPRYVDETLTSYKLDHIQSVLPEEELYISKRGLIASL